MYDNEPGPLGRNEPCWCGSGKKYKKCHAAIDERLQECYLNGQEVIYRHLLKTPEDIEGIKPLPRPSTSVCSTWWPSALPRA